MAKYKPTNEDQMVMLPISLQDQLVPGTLEHTINRLVDENIDLSVFDERYKNDETGATAIHPKILLKVILPGGTFAARIKRFFKRVYTLNKGNTYL